jgi:GxxExxY protein
MILSHRDEQTYGIIGALMAVHGELGHGFLEAVYGAALEREFTERQISFQREVKVPVFYRGQALPVSYRADFVCYSAVLIELKAVKNLSGVDEAQVINYLKASDLTRAILANFGTPSLQYRRFVRSRL